MKQYESYQIIEYAESKGLQAVDELLKEYEK